MAKEKKMPMPMQMKDHWEQSYNPRPEKNPQNWNGFNPMRPSERATPYKKMNREDH